MTRFLDPTRNFAKVTLSAGYDASATVVSLQPGEGAFLPQPSSEGAFNLTWWNVTDYSDPTDDPTREIVRCTARATDTLTIVRAQEGTTANAHDTGGKIYLMILAPTEKMIEDIEANFEYTARRVTGDTSMSNSDDIIEVDTSAGGVTVTLQPVATALNKLYKVKKVTADSHTVTVVGDSSELIDGQNSWVIQFMSSMELVPNYNNSAWSLH
jgi:hypothetical protein